MGTLLISNLLHLTLGQDASSWLRECSLDGRGDDVMRCLELGEVGIRACEYDQVAQGCPLCSGDPHIGMSGV